MTMERTTSPGLYHPSSGMFRPVGNDDHREIVSGSPPGTATPRGKGDLLQGIERLCSRRTARPSRPIVMSASKRPFTPMVAP